MNFISKFETKFLKFKPMKIKIIFNLLLFVLIGSTYVWGQVGIGINNPNENAVLDLTSSDKGVLLPRIALIHPENPNPLTQHVKGMVVFNLTEDNSVGLRIGLYVNDGIKWLLLLAEEEQVSQFSNIVYVNSITPSSATVFDTNSPPQNHNASLSQNSQNLYIGNSGLAYTWDGQSYVSFNPNSNTPWNIRGSSVDAGNDKNSNIERYADIFVQNVRLGLGAGNNESNTVVGGGGALGTNTTGDNNVALGYFALGSNTTGSSNFGMGFASLGNNKTGGFNVGLGRATLRWSTGSYNQAIGMQSFSAIGLSGNENVGIGWLTGLNTTGTSSSNTFLGSRAGQFHVSGSRNTAIGAQSDFISNNASNQVSIHNSLFAIQASSISPTTPTGSWGVNNPNPMSTLEVAGSFGANIRVLNTSVSMLETDHTIIMTAANTSVTLPDPATSNRRIIYIRNASGGTVAINGNIDGLAGNLINTSSGQTRTLHCNGVTWYVIGGLN
jgi:trimeric autotransporter adhesin